MGDVQVSSPPLNGAVFGDDRLCSSPLSPPLPASNPDPSSVAAEAWSRAEKTTREILCRIQPTLGANQRRKEVVEYIQRLIKYSIVCEVFPYGSVPLKTYLPDGDIDLTALSHQNIEDALVYDVLAILRGEERREGADYEVKDVRFIDAEVKLVKCIVQNIVVDISFNQLGGLCTLCFLEQVDRLVGKDHLFKRSIILIKAWCYYESRILGAHHGLISTYALETLVLYIFHQFHSSLNGPLAVLYRFLDYFSKFDWENYCVSLKGPVSKSSLPDIVAEVPENEGSNLLLTEEFIRNCVELFSVPSRGIEPNLRVFPQKHLNIIDPLKENNNLGRSVNRGNFYRIRSAFKYGARKLGWILMLPGDRIADELSKFFENTLGRHGSTQTADMHNPSLAGSIIGSDSLSSPLDTRVLSEDMALLSLSNSINKDITSGSQFYSEIRSERERYPVKDVTSQVGPIYDSAGDRNATSGHNLGVHSKNVVRAGALGMTNTNGSYCSDARSHFSALVSENSNLHLRRENGKTENWFSCREIPIDSNFDVEKEKHVMVSNPLSSHIDEKDMASYGSEVSNNAVDIFNNSSSAHGDEYTAGGSEGYKASKLLLELSGDYDSHIRNLQYGQICNGYAISQPVMHSPPPSPNLQNRNPWEAVRQSLQTNHNIHSQPNSNGVVGQVYLVNHPTPPMTFAPEENRKPRGTGAYLPNMVSTSHTYRDRPSQGRGRNQAPGAHGQLQRHARNNGLPPSPAEMKLPVEGSFELALESYPVLGSPKPRSSETHFYRPSMKGSHYANGFPHSSEKSESGHVSSQLHAPRRTEVSSHSETGTFISRGSVSSMGVLADENSNLLSGVDHKRIEVKAYRLKNEDDFPPLSH